MTQKTLPAIDIGARPGVRSDVTPDVMARWMPEVRAADGDDETTISILDVVGRDMFDEGVTARRISAALRRIGDAPVTVVINSPGGDVFEGIAIYNLLREHPQAVTVKVMGIAASAASIIAMAGDRIEIARSGFLMIHNSWVMAMGNRHDLRDVADYLDPFDRAMVEVYAAQTGQSAEALTRMMDAETWIPGADAVDQGFADDFLPRDATRIEDRDAAGAMRAERQFDLVAARAGLSRSAGKDLLASLKGGTPGAAPTGGPEAADIEQGLNAILQDLKSLQGT